MTSGEEMTKTKVICIEKIQNIEVDNFFHLKQSIVPKFNLKSSYFKNENFQTSFDGETTKGKVVDLKEMYNFIGQHFHLKSFI